MKNSNLKRRIARWAVPVCTAFVLGGVSTSCSDELLTGQPSWLGESIYEELESGRHGNFTETLKLINAQDEDYASVLRKTGSKTLFVADDAAWAEFYKNNPWGVKSIEGMTDAQKKLIFKANMINSAYLVELLGNVPSSTADEPVEGSCMRRATSVNIMDSVPLVTRDKYPALNSARVNSETGKQIDYWSALRNKEQVHMLQDDGVQSMIHFMPKFMLNNNITSDDVSFLTNGEINSNEGAFVNGKVITDKDITCQNGYIHVLEGVALPLDNMANVIANNPQFSIYSRLLDRFSYPHYDATINREYHRQFGGDEQDTSVYVRKYFNNHDNVPFLRMDDNTQVSTVLPYDPGWNLYRLSSTSGITYQNDAAAMLVPTNEALIAYLQTDGADLEERYGKAGDGETAWDNAPDAVVLPLLQNTMLTSLKSAVPSLFSSINNTAGERMGVEKGDIDSVLWACNGVIYQTNKVYVAPEYVSVYYPCVIRANDDLHIVYKVVEHDSRTNKENTDAEGYKAYLNNMGSKLSFIIPTDNALQTYYDPVSYKRTNSRGESTALAYKFKMDGVRVTADLYPVDWTSLDDRGRGTISDEATRDFTVGSAEKNDAFFHFKDILNNSLAVGTFVPGQKFYQSKTGSPIVVEWEGSNVKGVAGSFQYERGYFVPVTEMYEKESGNGQSYIVDAEPLMSTFTSPYAAITDSLRTDRFGSFANLLESMVNADDGASHATMDKCLPTLNNYHYTIYVPTNQSVDALVASHKLPTWDDIDDVRACIEIIDDKIAAEEATMGEDTTEVYKQLNVQRTYLEGQEKAMSDVIANFVNYHIQDNSVFVEGASHSNDVYESACLDTLTNRFVKLYVNYELGGDLTVIDNTGKTHRVDKDCCNILTRQYYFNGAQLLQSNACTRIFSSSFAVVHQIDTPLVPFENCYYDPAEYDNVQEVLAQHPVENPDVTPTPNPIKRRR
ncbi:MAG: hypothetical protein ILA39_00370 [Bacteroidaceae bacterium]|nr:hypothetical protein [Bacteroidaceae bacterium]